MFGYMTTHEESCLFTLQLSCVESCPGGPDVLKDHLTGNAVAIAVATPKPGQASSDGSRDGDVTGVSILHIYVLVFKL